MAVLEGDQVLGVCSRQDIGMRLGARYGFALFSRRPVRDYLSPSPMLVREGQPIKVVLETVFSRANESFYDDVLLLDPEGKFIGLIYVHTLVRLQTQFLRDSIGLLEQSHAGLKEAHKDLRAFQMELVEVEKMKSIGRLAAGVAHEVKNPLAIIMTGIDYLSQLDFSHDPVAPEILQEITVAIKRADHIVRGLLDFSTPKQLALDRHNLNEVIEEALNFTRGVLAAKQIELVRELAPDLPPLRLDKVKIGQVLVNLLTNAADAVAPSKGRITVRTYAQRITTFGANVGDVRSELFHAGDLTVAAGVEDNGTGIPEDALAKIFDPFFTTKKTGQGTGLGLTVSKTIMDLHGAALIVSNRKEGGALVTAIFPARS